MMRQVALFGGSFNPVHVAHQMVCLVVLETAAVDEVWMVPACRHPFAKELIDFADRARMCELAARVFGERVTVSRVEAELDLPRSRTLDTLLCLREQFPEIRFRLVIGADILAETGKWYRWDDVVALAPPIVVGRAGYPAAAGAALPARSTAVDLELPRISSTEIRKRLAEGESAVPLVPKVVMDYIEQRGLYR